jgi:hypothetical protein
MNQRLGEGAGDMLSSQYVPLSSFLSEKRKAVPTSHLLEDRKPSHIPHVTFTNQRLGEGGY